MRSASAGLTNAQLISERSNLENHQIPICSLFCNGQNTKWLTGIAHRGHVHCSFSELIWNEFYHSQKVPSVGEKRGHGHKASFRSLQLNLCSYRSSNRRNNWTKNGSKASCEIREKAKQTLFRKLAQEILWPRTVALSQEHGTNTQQPRSPTTMQGKNAASTIRETLLNGFFRGSLSGGTSRRWAFSLSCWLSFLSHKESHWVTD